MTLSSPSSTLDSQLPVQINLRARSRDARVVLVVRSVDTEATRCKCRPERAEVCAAEADRIRLDPRVTRRQDWQNSLASSKIKGSRVPTGRVARLQGQSIEEDVEEDSVAAGGPVHASGQCLVHFAVCRHLTLTLRPCALWPRIRVRQREQRTHCGAC